MRKALMTAQRMADELVQEAEKKKAEILRDAEAQASARKANISKELEAEEFRLQQAQKATAAFVEKVRTLQAQETEYLDRLQELYPPETTPAVDPVEETVSEIDDNVQRLLAQAMKDATEENLRARAAEESAQEDLEDTAEFEPVSEEERDDEDDGDEEDERSFRGSRIDFGDLQFGRDYEIK